MGVDFLNSKTLVISIDETPHIVSIPLSNEDETSIEWALGNEQSFQVSSDTLNMLDADPQKVFHILGSISLEMTTKIRYISPTKKAIAEGGS